MCSSKLKCVSSSQYLLSWYQPKNVDSDVPMVAKVVLISRLDGPECICGDLGLFYSKLSLVTVRTGDESLSKSRSSGTKIHLGEVVSAYSNVKVKSRYFPQTTFNVAQRAMVTHASEERGSENVRLKERENSHNYKTLSNVFRTALH